MSNLVFAQIKPQNITWRHLDSSLSIWALGAQGVCIPELKTGCLIEWFTGLLTKGDNKEKYSKRKNDKSQKRKPKKKDLTKR